jgi:hypothetical protein
MLARSPKQSVRFVLPEERELPANEQTVFLLRPLSVLEDQVLRDSFVLVTKSGPVMQAGAMRVALLRAGLVGWENLRDEVGAEVPFQVIEKPAHVLGRKVRHISDESIDRLDDGTIDVLTKAIDDLRQVSRDDAKN